jgi:hypothetical protein
MISKHYLISIYPKLALFLLVINIITGIYLLNKLTLKEILSKFSKHIFFIFMIQIIFVGAVIFYIGQNYLSYYDEFGFLIAAKNFSQFSELGITIWRDFHKIIMLEYYNWPPLPAITLGLLFRFTGQLPSTAFMIILTFATVNIFLFYLILRAHFKNSIYTPLAGSLFFALSPIYLKSASTLSNEIFMIFFGLLAYIGFLEHKKTDNQSWFLFTLLNLLFVIQCRFELLIFSPLFIIWGYNNSKKYFSKRLLFIGTIFAGLSYSVYPLFFMLQKPDVTSFSSNNFLEHILSNLVFFINPQRTLPLLSIFFIMTVIHFRHVLNYKKYGGLIICFITLFIYQSSIEIGVFIHEQFSRYGLIYLPFITVISLYYFDQQKTSKKILYIIISLLLLLSSAPYLTHINQQKEVLDLVENIKQKVPKDHLILSYNAAFFSSITGHNIARVGAFFSNPLRLPQYIIIFNDAFWKKNHVQSTRFEGYLKHKYDFNSVLGRSKSNLASFEMYRLREPDNND